MFVTFYAALAADVCTSWGETPGSTPVEGAPAEESSGVAASSTDAGIFYTHDDAGGAAALYVFNVDGSYLDDQAIGGATNVDWEDVSPGPCPEAVDAERCLWIGDIGNNEETRDTVSVYVVPESLLAAETAVECVLSYPEGKRRDAEALFVSPDGTLRIVSKENSGGHVYHLAEPACDGSTEVLVEEAELSLDAPVTGAAMSADGTMVILRSNAQAWMWSGCELDWSAAPTAIDLGSQAQGEGIAFATDGSLVATSEGEPFRVWTYPCAGTEAALDCPDCGCGGGDAAFLLLPLALLRRRQQ